MKRLRDYWGEEHGGGAAEFAIVALPFSALIFAIIHLSLMFYASQNLQFAVEGAARCSSVMSSTTCNSAGAVQTYAAGLYKGPNISPSFAYSTAGCGHTVTGTGSYTLNAVFVSTSVPMSVTACFP
jgi:Flp pilus assembly protein TadG